MKDLSYRSTYSEECTLSLVVQSSIILDSLVDFINQSVVISGASIARSSLSKTLEILSITTSFVPVIELISSWMGRINVES